MDRFRVFDLLSPDVDEVGPDEVVARLSRRDANGDNYVGVSAADAPYPTLGIFLHDAAAAVYLLDRESCSILAGDGSVPDAQQIEFRDPYEPFTVVFPGDVLVTTQSAIACFRAFASGEDWPRAITWVLL
jgi:hypothetical protein